MEPGNYAAGLGLEASEILVKLNRLEQAMALLEQHLTSSNALDAREVNDALLTLRMRVDATTQRIDSITQRLEQSASLAQIEELQRDKKFALGLITSISGVLIMGLLALVWQLIAHKLVN